MIVENSKKMSAYKFFSGLIFSPSSGIPTVNLNVILSFRDFKATESNWKKRNLCDLIKNMKYDFSYSKLPYETSLYELDRIRSIEG